MKTLLMVLIGTMLISIPKSNGQARMNWNRSAIIEEFKTYPIKSGYEENIPYLKITLQSSITRYYFDNDICFMAVVEPKTQGQLNYYVEKYNKDYVIISETEWRMYNDNGICRIRLIYPKEGGCYLLWTNLKD